MEIWQQTLIDQLFELQDKKYQEFHSRLIPTINPSLVIGVRVPALRKFAKEYAKNPDSKLFLASLPHTYYEENTLHGFLIEQIKDFDKAVEALDNFLPYVDNWATCDFMSVKILAKDKEKILQWINRWLSSDEIYVKRYAIKFLMDYCLKGNDFLPDYAKQIATIRTDEYYINMVIAWYFATALSMQWNAIIPYLENKQFDYFVHNKTIQKAIESYRITTEQKNYLRTLRIKNDELNVVNE